MNYNYEHIIHLLLNKHGWVRVPWFISLQPDQAGDGSCIPGAGSPDA